MPDPIQLTPDAMVLLPGSETPVPASQIIGFQSDYTRKMQQLAATAKQVEAERARAERAIEFVEALDEDPIGQLEALRLRAKAWAEQNNEDVPGWVSGEVESAQPQMQQAPAVRSSRSPIELEMAKRLEAMEQTLNATLARIDATKQVDELTREFPDLMKDQAYRERLAAEAARLPGASLKDAHRIAGYDLQQLKISKMEEELKALKRDQVMSTPGIGFGSSNFDLSKSDGEDENDALRSIFNSKIDALLD